MHNHKIIKTIGVVLTVTVLSLAVLYCFSDYYSVTTQADSSEADGTRSEGSDDLLEVEVITGDQDKSIESVDKDAAEEKSINEEMDDEGVEEVFESEVVVLANASCGSAASDMRQVALRLVNEVRSQSRQCGDEFFTDVRPVVWNELLTVAAQRHSDDMVRRNFFSHDSSDGSDLGQRAASVGYRYRAIGENIAAGQSTISEAVAGWVSSPGHCANLMNPQFKEVGVACTLRNSTDFGQYWTMVLGSQ